MLCQHWRLHIRETKHLFITLPKNTQSNMIFNAPSALMVITYIRGNIHLCITLPKVITVCKQTWSTVLLVDKWFLMLCQHWRLYIGETKHFFITLPKNLTVYIIFNAPSALMVITYIRENIHLCITLPKVITVCKQTWSTVLLLDKWFLMLCQHWQLYIGETKHLFITLPKSLIV